MDENYWIRDNIVRFNHIDINDDFDLYQCLKSEALDSVKLS